MSRYYDRHQSRQQDPVRQEFAAKTRNFYLDKMRAAVGLPPKDRTGEPAPAPSPSPPPPPAPPPGSQGPANAGQASTAPVCTCDDMGECDVCRDWARRMLELSRGKKP